jgi:hypothetical protein
MKISKLFGALVATLCFVVGSQESGAVSKRPTKRKIFTISPARPLVWLDPAPMNVQRDQLGSREQYIESWSSTNSVSIDPGFSDCSWGGNFSDFILISNPLFLSAKERMQCTRAHLKSTVLWEDYPPVLGALPKGNLSIDYSYCRFAEAEIASAISVSRRVAIVYPVWDRPETTSASAASADQISRTLEGLGVTTVRIDIDETAASFTSRAGYQALREFLSTRQDIDVLIDPPTVLAGEVPFTPITVGDGGLSKARSNDDGTFDRQSFRRAIFQPSDVFQYRDIRPFLAYLVPLLKQGKPPQSIPAEIASSSEKLAMSPRISTSQAQALNQLKPTCNR